MAQWSYERPVVVWHPVSVSHIELIHSSSFIFSDVGATHYSKCPGIGLNTAQLFHFVQSKKKKVNFNHPQRLIHVSLVLCSAQSSLISHPENELNAAISRKNERQNISTKQTVTVCSVRLFLSKAVL